MKKKKLSLVDKIKLDPKAVHRAGNPCMMCTHPRKDEIEADMREFSELRAAGTRITIRWLAEKHCLEEYKLRVSRETVRRHITNHMGLPV